MHSCEHHGGGRCGCGRLSDESKQVYIPQDLILPAVSVNKRIPLIVKNVTASDIPALKTKLAAVYGEAKNVTALRGDEVLFFEVSTLPCEDFDKLVLDGEKLTEHAKFDFSDLQEIMARLRGEGGCEWDRAQTHESIRINLIEEAYELVDAIDSRSRDMMLEEAGDVLLQAVFHTQIAKDEGDFGYGDMLTALCRKLLDRHTHIFGGNHADNAEQALGFWNAAKQKEKKYASSADAMSRVPRNLPALLYAEKIQKIAKKSGYDFENAKHAAGKVGEELDELLSAPTEDRVDEAGDLLFAAVNVVRLLGVEPEMALRAAAEKFERRFARAEQLAADKGKKLADCDADELDELWGTAKKAEKETDR